MNNFIKYPTGNPRSHLDKSYGIRSMIEENTGSSCYRYHSHLYHYWSSIKQVNYLKNIIYIYSGQNE